MALVVEDGTGFNNSDVYADFAMAVAYHATYGNSAWTTDQAKGEALLLRATQYVDARWGQRWRGEKKFADQALDWPRAYAEDDDGNYRPISPLPRALYHLVYEVALLMQTDPEFDQVLAANIRAQSSKIGPIEESIQYDTRRQALKQYPNIQRLARGLITGGPLAVPIMRS